MSNKVNTSFLHTVRNMSGKALKMYKEKSKITYDGCFCSVFKHFLSKSQLMWGALFWKWNRFNTSLAQEVPVPDWVPTSLGDAPNVWLWAFYASPRQKLEGRCVMVTKTPKTLNYNEYGGALKCYMSFSTQKMLQQCEQMCVFMSA